MASSGTYSFDPKLSGFVDEAFERCGIDPATIVHRHIQSARTSCEYMLADWHTRGVQLWKMDRVSQPLQANLASYTLAPSTMLVFDAVIRRNGSDTPCPAMSRDEYMTIPNKAQTGLPTRVLFERQARDSSITLWQVPENSTDTFEYYRLRRTEDVGTAPTSNVDIPWDWIDAFAAGLAARLALKFAFDRSNGLAALAEIAFRNAQLNNRERTDTQMSIRTG